MRTIAIVNLKGGVGKTVTAINTAAILAGDHQQRVLLIDADSQCNATEFFGGDSSIGSLAEILQYDYSFDFAVHSAIQHTKYENLDILPASDALMDLDLSKLEAKKVRSGAIMEIAEAATEEATEEDKYDYIIIDCPPAFSAASAAALLAADDIIIPIKLDAFSLRGMANLMRQVANMRKINPRLRVAGCLITMWYKDENVAEAEKQLRRSSLPVFFTVIRRTGKVDGMTFAQEPLSIYSPRSSAGMDYRKFVNEYRKAGVSHG